MKKEPVRPVVFNFWPLILLIMLVFTVLFLGEMVIGRQLAETNRLLSSFQRVDTVKEEPKNHWFCFYEGKNAKRFCVNSDSVGSVHFPDKPGEEKLSDPNLCYHWSSDCEDSKDCKSICHMNKEE